MINATLAGIQKSQQARAYLQLDAQVEAFDMAVKKTENVTDILHVAKVIRKELIEKSR